MNLAIVSSSFFDNHPPSVELFKQLESKHPWNEKILPIYQWDDVIYVGCSRPPIDLIPSNELKWVYVLCDEASLRRVWDSYQGELDPSGSLEGLDLDMPVGSTEINHPDDLFSTMTDINHPSPTLEKITLAAAPILEELEPQNLETENELEDLEKTSITQSDSHSLAPLEKAKPIKSEVLISAKPQSGSGFTKTSTQRFSPDMIKQKKPDEMAQFIFEEMGYHFNKSLIMLRETDILTPWKWSNGITVSDSATGVDFTNRSPFRVVFKTNQSYHGYVVPNEVNDKFFHDYNSGETPDHITISPILIDDHLVGVLVGIGDKSADNKNSLALSERLSELLSDYLKSHKNLLNEAA